MQAKYKELQELKQRIDFLEEQKERVRAQMESTTAILDDMPKGNKKSDKMLEGIIKLCDIQEELNNKTVFYHALIRDMEQDIGSIENPVYRTILRMCLFDGLTIAEMADALNYSTRHIDRLCKEAKGKVNMS